MVNNMVEGKIDGKGFFFVRILNSNADHNKITIAVVKDETLKELKNSAEVKARIAKNMNKASYYSDTLHFYKVRGYQLTFGGAVDRAN